MSQGISNNKQEEILKRSSSLQNSPSTIRMVKEKEPSNVNSNMASPDNEVKVLQEVNTNTPRIDEVKQEMKESIDSTDNENYYKCFAMEPTELSWDKSTFLSKLQGYIADTENNFVKIVEVVKPSAPNSSNGSLLNRLKNQNTILRPSMEGNWAVSIGPNDKTGNSGNATPLRND